MAKTKTYATADSQPVSYRGWTIRLDRDVQRHNRGKGYLFMWAVDNPARRGHRYTELTLENAKRIVDALIAGAVRF